MYEFSRDHGHTPRERHARHFPSRFLLAALLTALLVGTYGSAVAQAERPVAAYSFDEGSGTTAKDSGGNHNGTITGATGGNPSSEAALHDEGALPDSRTAACCSLQSQMSYQWAGPIWQGR
jgi:hypothetical protein